MGSAVADREGAPGTQFDVTEQALKLVGPAAARRELPTRDVERAEVLIVEEDQLEALVRVGDASIAGDEEVLAMDRPALPAEERPRVLGLRTLRDVGGSDGHGREDDDARE